MAAGNDELEEIWADGSFSMSRNYNWSPCGIAKIAALASERNFTRWFALPSCQHLKSIPAICSS
jgi:hypothetical protein